MKLLVIIPILLILSLLVYLYFSIITVTVRFKHMKGGDQFTVELKAIHGLFVKKLRIPGLEAQQESVQPGEFAETEPSGNAEKAVDRVKPDQDQDPLQKWFGTIRQFHNLMPMMKRSAKKIRVSKFALQTAFGTGEAASTGKLTGAVWTAAGFIRKLLSFFTVDCHPDISVMPQFNRMTMELELDCIFRIRIGEAILTACKLFYHWKRSKQVLLHEGKQTQQSENEIT